MESKMAERITVVDLTLQKVLRRVRVDRSQRKAALAKPYCLAGR
jgi:hypothetical protein